MNSADILLSKTIKITGLSQSMEETKFIWMDGRLVEWKEAKIHVLTHSLHYGSGVFEGIRFYEADDGKSAVFRLKEHVERLFKSAKAFNMQIPFSQEQICSAILETIRVNEIKAGYIRPIAYFGYGKMGLGLKGAPVNVAIAVWPWGAYLGEKPVRVKTSSFMRIHPKTSFMEAKITGHYVNSIFASEEVQALGYDEALLLDFEGNIAEGPGENLFIVKNGVLITPKLGTILAGITRDSIIQIAKDEKINIEEKTLKLDDAYSADEAFFTGTAAEVTLIESLDDKKIGNGNMPITEKLKQIFLDAVKGKNKKYEGWLSYV
jgi:branched-chain amino acid aminotransferase